VTRYPTPQPPSERSPEKAHNPLSVVRPSARRCPTLRSIPVHIPISAIFLPFVRELVHLSSRPFSHLQGHCRTATACPANGRLNGLQIVNYEGLSYWVIADKSPRRSGTASDLGRFLFNHARIVGWDEHSESQRNSVRWGSLRSPPTYGMCTFEPKPL
jgi:hypothetical protein